MLVRPQSGPVARASRERQDRQRRPKHDGLPSDLALEANRARKHFSPEELAELASPRAEAHRRRVQESMAQLRAQISLMEKELTELKHENPKTPKLFQQIRIAENRLDKALVRYNQAIELGANLRESIDSLRKEWFVYDCTFKKLENEIQQKREQIAVINQQTVQACKARDIAQARVTVMKDETAQEREKFLRLSEELNLKLNEHRILTEGGSMGHVSVSLTTSSSLLEADGEEQNIKVPTFDKSKKGKTANPTKPVKTDLKSELSQRSIHGVNDASILEDPLSKPQASEAIKQSDICKNVPDLSTQKIVVLECESNRFKNDSTRLHHERSSGPDTGHGGRLLEESRGGRNEISTMTNLEEDKLRQIKKKLSALKPILTETLNTLGVQFNEPLDENHFVDAMRTIESKLHAIIRKARDCDDDLDVYTNIEPEFPISVGQLPSVDLLDEKDTESDDDSLISIQYLNR